MDNLKMLHHNVAHWRPFRQNLILKLSPTSLFPLTHALASLQNTPLNNFILSNSTYLPLVTYFLPVYPAIYFLQIHTGSIDSPLLC